MKLCDYELSVLRECAGEKQQGLAWGAAMGAALEILTGAGLVRKTVSPNGIKYEASAKGQAELALIRSRTCNHTA